MDVDELVAAVIAREGGYVDHPDDRGGPTCFGITEAVARREGYDGAMRMLPRAMAVAIYCRRYWTEPNLAAVASRAPDVAAALFDIAVNMGPAVAAGFLQRGLNALNRGARDYADVSLDSSIGPATLAALDGFLAHRGSAGEAVLLKAIGALKGARYIALAEQRPASEAFLYGWLNNRMG